MIDNKFINNIKEFIDELIELLKEDWIKFKKFVKENKNYLIWLFIALITFQITDIMSLGSSYNIYCKKSNINQQGGSKSDNAIHIAKIEAAKKKIVEKKQKEKDAKQKEKDAKKKDKPISESNDIDKKLKIFNRLKGKISDSSGQHGMMGPVFNNLQGIFGALEGIVAIFTFILIVVGVISLPILVFLVITYSIIKYTVGKVALI